MKSDKCTWCGRAGGSVLRKDAVGREHLFHKACWKAHGEWVSGLSCMTPPVTPVTKVAK